MRLPGLVRRLIKGYALLAAPWVVVLALTRLHCAAWLFIIGGVLLCFTPCMALLDALGIPSWSDAALIIVPLTLILETGPLAYLVGGSRRPILTMTAVTALLLALSFAVALHFLVPLLVGPGL